MQKVKRHFFALRNGIIADVLRKGGSPFRIIFGLNLPQIVEVAEAAGTDSELAEALWANRTTRESMLAAPMLVDRSVFTTADALRWASEVPCAEVADSLCHRLLRHLPEAWQIAETLVNDNPGDFGRYTGLRLAFNLVAKDPARALSLARSCPAEPLASSLAEEAEFLAGE
ncbi:MAG: DNA alkylation repair protein [Muribaculaceae bacterium]|nr:DNA alkylation repair protein [Muribaculaceae bacterium]